MILDKRYVDKAEEVILKQGRKNEKGYLHTTLSTSKLRNILDMTSIIYNEITRVKGDEIPDNIKEKLLYLRIKIVYECGRESSVKRFIEDGEILKIIKEIYDKGKKEDLIDFCKYMEALVAYFKYIYGASK